MISRLSIALDKHILQEFDNDLHVPESLSTTERLQPKDRVQIYANGELMEASWGLIPSSAENDLQQLNRIGVLAEELSHSTTYRLIARRNRGLLWAKAFYHNTMKGGVRIRHQFTINSGAQFTIPLVFDHWRESGSETSLCTFSLLHQRSSASAEKIPSIVPVILLNKRDMKAWLNMDNRPSRFIWPGFDPKQFSIQSREMDVKMRPSFKAVYPADDIPDYLNNIA